MLVDKEKYKKEKDYHVFFRKWRIKVMLVRIITDFKTSVGITCCLGSRGQKYFSWHGFSELSIINNQHVVQAAKDQGATRRD